MPVRKEPWPEGTPCWADLAVPDVAAAMDFYRAVFGWEFEDMGDEFGNYRMCRRDGHIAAGLGPTQSPDQPTVWTTYLSTSDLDATVKTIRDNGGTILLEPMDVPNAGRMLIAVDTQGAVFGVWQSAGMHGAEIYNEPGAMVWNQVSVPNPAAAREFYAALFGCGYERVDGTEDYHTIQVSGQPVGGIGDLSTAPPGTPPHWLAFFMVEDTDAAVAAAKQHTATSSEPMDTAYGRMAVITDPQGAVFGVFGPSPNQG